MVREEDLTYFIDENEEDYEDDLSIWNYNDWIASGIETSADFHQFFDNDIVRVMPLSSPNSTVLHDSLSSSNLFSSDSLSSSLIYSFIDLTENCISPALSQLINQLYWILLYCCLFRLLYLSKLFSVRQLHFIQICSSMLILYNYFHFQSIYLFTYIFMGYLSFQVCLVKCRHYLGCIITCFSVIYVLSCEFILIEQEKWHSIRGVQMCIMMKMISLASDYTFLENVSTLNTNDSTLHPTTLEFLSYVLSIHNTIFGPWINYRNYIRYFYESNSIKKIDFFELTKWVYYFIRAALCLLISTCLTNWFLDKNFFYNDDQDNTSQAGDWRTAYIQALSYRFSHYCVCFIGELTGQISGLEFSADEYRCYTQICQQAQQRIDSERKLREKSQVDSMSIGTDHFQSGKRKHKNKKNSHNCDILASTGNNDVQYETNSISENISSSTFDIESTNHDESDTSYNRRHPKKSYLNTSLTSTKLKSKTSRITIPVSSLTTSSNEPNSSSIVKLAHIELPRSLVDVVVNWNLPMHYWLKIYVYIPTKQKYGHFPSVFLTYLASALLHGFNFQLSIVLFSIGLFAYVEYGFRRKLANILDACVAARACSLRSSCDKHTYTYWHPLTIVINVFLCLLSLWHLTYLGQLFDGSSQETIGYSWQHVLDKWAKLNFASHLVVIGTYAIFRSL